MALQLDFRKLKRELSKLEDLDTEQVYLPETIDRDKFAKFERMLKAKTPDEISDISVEDLISMYSDLEDFCKVICFDVLLKDSFPQAMQRMRSETSGLRRVL